MRRVRSVAVLVSCVLLACAGGGARRGSDRAIPRDEVRAEINRYVCAAWSEDAQQWSAEFLSETCRSAPPKTRLALAIRRAISRVEMIVPLGSGAYDHFYNSAGQHPRGDQRGADELARAAIWSDLELQRGTWLGVCDELRTEGLSCEVCATISPPRRLELSWSEFFPYLAAFVWPAPREGDRGVEIFVCSEVNGASGLPGTKELRHAGFLAAAAIADDPELSAIIQRLASEHRGTDLSAVSWGIEALLSSPDGRGQACSGLARSEWFTGVSVRDCRTPR